MTTTHLPDWTIDLPLSTDLWLDVGFTVDEAFYHGPHNDVDAILAGRYTAIIPHPDLDIWLDEYALTLAVAGNERKLVDYYQGILDLAERHRKPINEIGHYFWVNPVLAEEEPLIEFERYDYIEDSLTLLDAISSEKDGLIYTDRRGDWQIDMIASNDDLYIREWDWESEEDYAVLRVPRQRFRLLALSAKERTEKIMERLTGELKTNFWSRDSGVFID